jgi:hypothetical protein
MRAHLWQRCDLVVIHKVNHLRLDQNSRLRRQHCRQWLLWWRCKCRGARSLGGPTKNAAVTDAGGFAATTSGGGA